LEVLAVSDYFMKSGLQVDEWKNDYNDYRIHKSLNNKAPIKIIDKSIDKLWF